MDRVDLIRYLPQFMREYKELKELFKAEEPELEQLFKNIEKIKNNQFIISCDTEGISRFEKLLGINTIENEPLEDRIARVLLRWNDKIPYTFEVFLEKMKIICGENFEVKENFKAYEIKIETHLERQGQVEELEYLLKYIMPCNIEVVSNNNYTFEVLGEANIVTGICLVGYFELSDNFKEAILLEGNANVGTGLNDLYIDTFTDCSKEEHILKGDLYAKGVTVGTVECSIIDNI